MLERNIHNLMSTEDLRESHEAVGGRVDVLRAVKPVVAAALDETPFDEGVAVAVRVEVARGGARHLDRLHNVAIAPVRILHVRTERRVYAFRTTWDTEKRVTEAVINGLNPGREEGRMDIAKTTHHSLLIEVSFEGVR